MSLNLNLNIRKPLVFLKVATTGFKSVEEKKSQRDRIIEISLIRIEPDRTVKSGSTLINPEMSISENATKANGITNEMVANSPTFKEKASGLFNFIGDADIAGFNISNFDLKFLAEEFNRAGFPFTIIGRNIIDLSSIYNTMEKRDFRAAAEKFYGNKLTSESISSETANNISIGILNGMVSSYISDSRFAGATADGLSNGFNRNLKSLDVHSKIVLNKDGRPVFSFGKYNGLLVADAMISDPQYYDWCVNASDLPGDTKFIIKRIVEKAQSTNNSNPQSV